MSGFSMELGIIIASVSVAFLIATLIFSLQKMVRSWVTLRSHGVRVSAWTLLSSMSRGTDLDKITPHIVLAHDLRLPIEYSTIEAHLRAKTDIPRALEMLRAFLQTVSPSDGEKSINSMLTSLLLEQHEIIHLAQLLRLKISQAAGDWARHMLLDKNISLEDLHRYEQEWSTACQSTATFIGEVRKRVQSPPLDALPESTAIHMAINDLLPHKDQP